MHPRDSFLRRFFKSRSCKARKRRRCSRGIVSPSLKTHFNKRKKFSKGKLKRLKIKNFEKWCSNVDIRLHPNISITWERTCDGVGVVATHPIKRGECVAEIPRSAVLCCANVSSVAERITEDHTFFSDSTSSWLPLLLALTLECSKKNSTDSKSHWDPYLSLVPNHLSRIPMLWNEGERRELTDTPIQHWVSRDQERIRHDYDTLAAPFMRRNKDIFKYGVCSYEEFERLTAFVMAYSFTDSGAGFLSETGMVPFVDLLNHSSCHHVELTFHPSHLRLQAVRDIEEGEEVMNTYGALCNAELLHQYGFTERNNLHDEVIISSDLIRQVCLSSLSISARHWDRLCDKGVVEEEYGVCSDGTPDPQLIKLLHRLVKGRRLSGSRTMPTCIEQCPHSVLSLLHSLARTCLEATSQEPQSPCTSVRKFLCYLMDGQKNSLIAFLKKIEDAIERNE